MYIHPSIFSLIGLFFDIIGFALISYAIIYPPKIGDEEITEIQDANGEPLFTTLNFLKKDVKANIGFWLVILGFIFQFLGTLLSML